MVRRHSPVQRYVSPRCRTLGKFVGETAGAHEPRAIVAVAQVTVRNRTSRARRMNEASGARVDPDMIDAALVDVEEDEITRSKLAQRHGACGALLFARRARNRETEALVHVEREPAAVEAGRVGAAEVIGSADQGDRERRNGCAVLRRRGGAARMA